MDFHTVTLGNIEGKGPSLSFSMYGEANEPYVMTGITGLDVDSLQRTDIGGSYIAYGYLGTRSEVTIPTREVVIEVSLNPFTNEPALASYGKLRSNLYRLIAASGLNQVALTVVGATKYARLVCVVTKLESEPFSEDPRAKITLRSVGDPRLVDPFVTTVDVSSAGDELTFTDSYSTAPHGCDLTLTATENVVSGQAIRLVNDVHIFTTNVPFGVFAGDSFRVATSSTYKKVELIRGGEFFDIAEAVGAYTQWPTVYPGENTFTKHESFDWVSLTHFISYWGV